jgi:nucleotide-binding universal stress UspA family protein
MFSKIVVGTDGSETASEAVKQAADLAKISKSELNIVSAFEPVSQAQLREEARDVPGDVSNAVNPREVVNVTLEKASGIAKQAKVAVQTHPREGDPADAILDVAEDIKADLIIVGNKGMTGAKRFLLGSVPNKVSHHAPCSVMIIQTT